MEETVYLMQATKAQIDTMMNFLDLVLKRDGLGALQEVVDIYNVLTQAQRMQLAPEPAQQQLAEQDMGQVKATIEEK